MNSRRSLGNEGVNYRLNMISLEITKVKGLDKLIKPPKILRCREPNSICWSNFWPLNEDKWDERPSFNNYCLIGVKDSYTDWHVDLGGTSVWYHIVSGGKIFILVKPTEENRRKYIEWEQRKNKCAEPDENQGSKLGHKSLDENEHRIRHIGFLEYCSMMNKAIPDDEVFHVEFGAGETLLLPSGWIHCVITTEDALVFGGNLLHDYCAESQINVFNDEREYVDPKFMLNGFKRFHWYSIYVETKGSLAWQMAQFIDEHREWAAAIKNQHNFTERKLNTIERIQKFLASTLDHSFDDDDAPAEFAKPKKETCKHVLKRLNSSVKEAKKIFKTRNYKMKSKCKCPKCDNSSTGKRKRCKTGKERNKKNRKT